MKKQTKLMLKGISEESGAPFTKEIHTLDEVKSSGSYVVICKNANSDNGLPSITGKSRSCFCCEAQLNVTCCYSEDEAQSNTAYGQTLTICDRETGATNTYTRTISPGKNNDRWSEWQMIATGDIQLMEQNNDIVNAFSELSKEIDTAVSSATALHFNYIGNYPFSQKVIDAGIDKMIIAGYLDIDYEDGKAYCFSVVSKEDKILVLYKKDKDLKASNSRLTQIASFNVAKIDGSPYYLAKSTSSPRSWIVLDWENVKNYNSLYDYDGIGLSPALFKNNGICSYIADIPEKLYIITNVSLDVFPKRDSGIFISCTNGVYSINTESISWESWLIPPNEIKSINAVLGRSSAERCNVVFLKDNKLTIESIISHISSSATGEVCYNVEEIPEGCVTILLSNRTATLLTPSAVLYIYKPQMNGRRINEITTELDIVKDKLVDLSLTNNVLVLELGANNGGAETISVKRARTKTFISTPFAIEVNDGYLIKAIYKYTANKEYIGYETINKTLLNQTKDEYCYKVVFSKTDDSQIITENELPSIVKEFKGVSALDRDNLIADVNALKNQIQIFIPNVYITNRLLTIFPTYAALIAAYDELAESHPWMMQKNSLGMASDGQEIFEYLISSGQLNREGKRGVDETINKPLILLEAGIHGYEPGSNTSLYIFVSDLVNGNLSLSKIRDNLDFKIIPCLNPYGYDHYTRGNANNVDLNRNFDAEWTLQGDPSAAISYYSGPFASSEVETQIMQKWLQDNVNASLFIDFHNSDFSNEISCIGGSNALAGMTEFKMSYLVGVQKISAYMTSILGLPDNSLWGYTYTSSLGGSSGAYRTNLGIIGCVLETLNDIKGLNSPTANAIGANILGTTLLSAFDLFKY